MYVKSKFLSTPMKFETPKALEAKIKRYIRWVDDQNKPVAREFCPVCGKPKNKYRKDLCCDEPYRIEMVYTRPEDQVRPTYYGFASFAGVTRKTLYSYGKREEFCEILDQFKTYLQADIEQLLLNPYTRNVHGAKFVAINNYGWAERVEMTGKDGGPIEVGDVRSKLIEKLTQGK